MSLQKVNGIQAIIVRRPQANRLIVLLHGWTDSPHSFSELRPELEAAFPEADFLIPKMPLGWASLTDLDALAERLDGVVAAFARGATGDELAYERITLVGHSCGGILARQLYLAAFGVRLAPGTVQVPDAPTSDWTHRVDRIVLLAAINRGWTISSAMPAWLRFLSPLAIGFGHLLDMIPWRTPVIFQIRRGSSHLTNMRLKWMALEQAKPNCLPHVVQLLGTTDDIVAPEDNIDLVTGARFTYLEAAHSGHFDIIKTLDRTQGPARAALICAALGEPLSELAERLEHRKIRAQSVASESSANVMSNHAELGIDGSEGTVCFIIHGIRDNEHWTQKIGERVLDRATQKSKSFFVYTPSYGYFPLIAFALPWTRREKVAWFLDLYVDVLNRHPNARMVFVGHSNGTYLLANALTLCPSLRFDRVLFAGSVVRRNYDWPSRLNTQVLNVINLVATNDYVVALFPRAFERLPVQDLGGAGVDGFKLLPAEGNRRYVPGSHDAGIREEMWNDIAAFVVTGDRPMRDNKTIDGKLLLEPRIRWLVRFAAEVSPLSWLLIIGAILGGAWWMLFVLPVGDSAPPAWVIAVSLCDLCCRCKTTPDQILN